MLNSRWAGLEYLIEMREVSGGNSNGMLMTSSAPLGWFDSDYQDELYKWLIDSGHTVLLPRRENIPNLANFNGHSVDRPENVYLAVTNGFGDHLPSGFRQFIHSRSSQNVGWGPAVIEEQGSPQCRMFYKCGYTIWCGTGVDCRPGFECKDFLPQ